MVQEGKNKKFLSIWYAERATGKEEQKQEQEKEEEKEKEEKEEWKEKEEEEEERKWKAPLFTFSHQSWIRVINGQVLGLRLKFERRVFFLIAKTASWSL